jgi:hypothetical protein
MIAAYERLTDKSTDFAEQQRLDQRDLFRRIMARCYKPADHAESRK